MNASAISLGADDPIFVCGPPRSGVRLLATILAEDSVLGSGPELPIVVTIAQQWRDLDATLGVNHEKNYCLSRDATREAFRAAILKLFAERLRRLDKRIFVYHSFAAALCMDTLAALFPRAKFVLTLRDPRAIAHSLLQCRWRNPRTGVPLAYTQNASAGGMFVAEFMQLALRAASASAMRDRVIFLRYEDLCGSAAVLQELASFLAIEPIQPRISSDAAAELVASQDTPHPPLRPGTIDSSSVDRWRKELNPTDVASIESTTAPLLRAFGYIQ